MRASDYALDFADQLERKHTDYEFKILAGRKFDKITIENKTRPGRSVHAFVVRGTGELVKAATFSAPQKDKDGLAVRYNLSDPVDARRALEQSDPYGSYLYKS